MQKANARFRANIVYRAVRKALVEQAGINGPRAQHYQFCQYYGLSDIG